MSKVTTFLLGLLLGAALLRPEVVGAAERLLMFGTFSGAPKAVTVDTSGNVNVVLH